MERHTKRKVATFGFSVVAAVLVLSSVAFACVQSRGKISVTGDNGRTATAVGNGHHPGNKAKDDYVYCRPAKYLRSNGAQSFSPNPAAGHVTVSLGLPPADCQYLLPDNKSTWITNATTPNVFTDGTYQVNFCQSQNGEPVFTGPPLIETDHSGSCYFNDGVTDWGVLLGDMTVTGNVAPPTTFRIPFGAFTTDPGTWAGVSVRRTGPGGCGCGPPPVNMAPIALV